MGTLPLGTFIEELGNVLVLIIAPFLIMYTEDISIGSVLFVDTLISPFMKVFVGISILCAGGYSSYFIDLLSRIFNVIMIVLPILFWYVLDENNVSTRPILQEIRLHSVEFFKSIQNNRPLIRWYSLFSGYTTWGVILAIAVGHLYGNSPKVGMILMLLYGVVFSILSMLGVPQYLRRILRK